MRWTPSPTYPNVIRMKMKRTDYKTELGLLLRTMRTSQGISQEAFADQFDINRTYYGKVERGENSISLDKLQNISSALGIPLSELFRQIEHLN